MNIILIVVLMIILLIIAWLLFSNKNEKTPPKTDEIIEPVESEPEKIFRRRSSDRAIEQEFPEEPEKGIDQERIKRSEPSGVLELPFSANEIIPDNSRFKLYKRTLVNSEIYAIKGDYETAISLFQGVSDRISDFDVKSKIESNIEYLNLFRKRREEDVKKKMESMYSSQLPGQSGQPGELKLKIDGQVPQTINIGLSEKNFNTDDIIKKISEQISGQLLNVKDEIEKLKTETDQKLLPDKSEELHNLQNELSNLKEKFTELDNDKNKALNELNRLYQTREYELKLLNEKEKDLIRSELLNQIKDDMRGFSDLKNTLDKLNNKIENLSNLKIPESSNEPRIVHAKYESSIPVHFDPEPVLEILESISRQGNKIKVEPEPVQKPLPEPLPEPEPTPEPILESKPEPEQTPAPKPEPEPEIKSESLPEPVPEPEPLPEPFELQKAPDEYIKADEIIEDKSPLPLNEEIKIETAKEEIPKPKEEKIKEPAKEDIIETPYENILHEKEKEIQKHIDEEEDPNEFELLSDYGQTKDESTLTDEDIFEKILKGDEKKADSSEFEILGDFQKDEPEYSLDDTTMDERIKAEHDFYKKFIKPDRIKKKELPILKVSYDFKKLPDEFSLSREKNILEYSFYRYKPMLVRADEFIKQRRVKDAINYYRVVMDQNIPVEFKKMIRKNIRDLTEYLEKYLGAE
ncbi:MAG: hypothetical protein WDA74_09365 [Spirochaetota bacterium]